MIFNMRISRNTKSPAHPHKRLLILSRLCSAAAIAVLLAGLLVSWNQHQANKIGVQTPQQEEKRNPSTSDVDAPSPAPSTTKPDAQAFDTYQVAADVPRYIFIPKISVRAMVKPVGTTADNRIAAPRNVFDAGWYTKSAKPGQAGATLIDGHLSSWETRGIFYDLQDLTQGDEIIIERGDGTTLAYKIVRSQTYDAGNVDMPAALAPINPDKSGLNLITCGGKVIPGTNDFDKRIVVFAEQI